ncbi:MAG: TIGR00282 family metallophosphoesterase [bacterium]|nr:TIGR00282 family metallophosphoesterase [bacterium]
MRILFVGDVVGEPGRRFLKRALRRVRRDEHPDFILVNGENSAAGAGITPSTADDIFRAGADAISTGNHVWDRKEAGPLLDENERIVRPANYPDPAPGNGVCLVEASNGIMVAVINLMGRVFMGDFEDPFRTADAILDEIGDQAHVILVDFHAEATSEKIALGWYLDGRVSGVFGTHTHVPTADARVLPGGTAYVTDVGMTGPYDSIIGVDREAALKRFLTQRPVRLTPAVDDVRMDAVLIELSEVTGRAESIRTIQLREQEFSS